METNNNETGEKQNVIIEIRAGTGGDEAGLFASDLFRMYSKYADSQGWEQKILHSHPSEVGGLKEIIFELRGDAVFDKMRYEGGVHRVQRIPQTEKKGRIHTSTATVAVLTKPKSQEIIIRPEDIEVDCYRSSGPGGQYTNKRDTAVRLHHKASGIIVSCQSERSQVQNKESAMALLEAKLAEKQEMDKLKESGDERRAQIKWAKRAEKIRTYNFPQNRLTDHRIGKSWHNLDQIIEGNLRVVMKSLTESKLKEED